MELDEISGSIPKCTICMEKWGQGRREDNIEKGDGGGLLKLLIWHMSRPLCLSCVVMGIFVPVKFHLERLQVILELIRYY